MRTGTRFGRCRLCANECDLHWSHIISQWTYRRIARTSKNPNPVIFDGEVARIGGKQLAEYMLCKRCEKILEPDERYAATISRQPAGNFPALERVRATSDFGEGTALAASCDLDRSSLTRFIVGIVWRSAVCSDSKIEVPEQELGILREFLLRGSTGELPRNVFVVLELICVDRDLPLDEVVLAPVGGTTDDLLIYQFALFGLRCALVISSDDNPSTNAYYSRACFERTGQVLLSDGRPMIRPVAFAIAKSNEAGGLARRRERHDSNTSNPRISRAWQSRRLTKFANRSPLASR